MRFRRFGSSAAVALAVFAAHAGTLRVGVPEIDGSRVILPVLLEGDVSGGVAAMDFVVQYDPAVFEPVSAEAGTAAVAARKQVQSSEVSPGNYVVLLFGMNQTTITGGQVANIVLNTKGQPAENQAAVAIEDTTLSSIDGIEIPSSGSAQTVTFPPPVDDGGTPDDDSGGDDAPPPPVDDDVGVPQPEPDRPESVQPTEPATPVFPGAPTGKPELGNSDGSRVSPIAVGTPSEDSAPMAGTAGRLARMNEAAQRLDSARATLSAPTVDGSEGTDEVGQGGPDDDQHAPVSTPMNTPVPGHPDEPTLKVATTIPPSNIKNALPPSDGGAATRQATDSLTVSGRRYLMGGAILICVAWLAFRFTRRRTH